MPKEKYSVFCRLHEKKADDTNNIVYLKNKISKLGLILTEK